MLESLVRCPCWVGEVLGQWCFFVFFFGGGGEDYTKHDIWCYMMFDVTSMVPFGMIFFMNQCTNVVMDDG
jgi:hypothetical protein